jgi:hypothetical protein
MRPKSSGLGVDRLLLLRDRLLHELLLELRRQDELEHAEVRGVVVEVDPGVLGRAGGLLVGGEEGVLERCHQRVGVNSLLLLETPDGLDDLTAHLPSSNGVE